MKYTQASISGLSTSHSCPNTVLKCCARSRVRASSTANERRRHASRMYGTSGGSPTRCGS